MNMVLRIVSVAIVAVAIRNMINNPAIESAKSAGEGKAVARETAIGIERETGNVMIAVAEEREVAVGQGVEASPAIDVVRQAEIGIETEIEITTTIIIDVKDVGGSDLVV